MLARINTWNKARLADNAKPGVAGNVTEVRLSCPPSAAHIERIALLDHRSEGRERAFHQDDAFCIAATVIRCASSAHTPLPASAAAIPTTPPVTSDSTFARADS